MFSKKCILALTALTAATQAAFTASDVVDNLKKVTDLSSDTNKVAMKISLVNFFTTAPDTINNFRTIISTVVDDINSMATPPTTPFPAADQTDICNAFRDFVVVHQRLLNTVIGKHGILSLTPFTAPVAAVLRAVEGGVDSLAFSIIDQVPTCATKAIRDKEGLDSTLNQAIIVYSS